MTISNFVAVVLMLAASVLLFSSCRCESDTVNALRELNSAVDFYVEVSETADPAVVSSSAHSLLGERIKENVGALLLRSEAGLEH